MKLKLPNTFVLLFAILCLIAAASWLIPGGKYDLHMVDGKQLIDPASFRYLPQQPQGLVALLTSPVKGFSEAGLIIGFVFIVGGVFAVLHKTAAIDAMIHSIVRAHVHSTLVRRMLIPFFVCLFSLGGATFGMAEEAIPFVLIFIPLALALGYDSVLGVAIPFVGSQAGFAAAFLNPFNVGVAQSIAHLPIFSGLPFRLVVWCGTTVLAILFLSWYAARIKRQPTLSPVYALDQQRRKEGSASLNLDAEAKMSLRHKLILLSFLLTLVAMIVGVVQFKWFVEEISALFLAMSVLVAVIGRLSPDDYVSAFLQGARDMVTTALVIGLARATVILARDAQIIDTMLHGMAPLIQSAQPMFAAHKMFVIQSVINFFIHSGTGQAALTMPIMAPLADIVGVSRQTAVLAFQLGELTTPIIPTSGITVGVLALARIPWITWVKWMIPLQIAYFLLALLMLGIACQLNW